MKDPFPKRIVCLTEETTETLYLLGQEHRIVGISHFTKRPERARKEKPRVSHFTDGDIGSIIALRPDLVLGFSDIQADLAAELIRKGLTVTIYNQRSVKEILDFIVRLGATVGATDEALRLRAELEGGLNAIKSAASKLNRRPRVYFEEWFDPLITGIEWVADLIDIAGGENCFPEMTGQSLAKNRIIADSSQVIEEAPEIIFASWCGKKFKKNKMISRAGWDSIPAVRDDEIWEISSDIILQPGPASLSEGVAEIHGHISDYVRKND